MGEREGQIQRDIKRDKAKVGEREGLQRDIKRDKAKSGRKRGTDTERHKKR